MKYQESIQDKPLYKIGSTSFDSKEARNAYLLRRVEGDLQYLMVNANSGDKDIIKRND
jgi:hypothetical protein